MITPLGWRNVVGAVSLGVFAIAWFATAIAMSDPVGVPAAGFVLGGTVGAVAEVLPAHSVRAAIRLRVAGAALFAAAIPLMVALPALNVI